MTLRRQLSIVRSWWPLLLVSVLLAGAGGWAVASVQPTVYEAQSTLIVGESLSGADPDYNQLLVSQRLASTYARVATTRPVIERVIERLGLDDTPELLARRIQISSAPENALLTLVARDGDPARAAAIANALGEELIAVSRSMQGQEADLQQAIEEDLQTVRRQIDDVREEIAGLNELPERTAEQDARLDTLEARLADLRSTYTNLLSLSLDQGANVLTIIEPAVAPLQPVAPRPPFTALLAAVVGLFVATAIAFISEYLNDSVSTREEVDEALGLPTLGTISRMRGDRRIADFYRLAALLYPKSSVAEAYRTLRVNLEFASIDAPIRTLLVTSGNPSEGKTVTAANLAIVFAQAGRRVLLVDGDLRKPGMDRMFKLPNTTGLTALLRNEVEDVRMVARPTEHENLLVLTTGPVPPNPAELLGSQRMRSVIAGFRASFDLVIFDSPPVRVVTDGVVLSGIVDGTLLVVHARRSRRARVREALEALRIAEARVLGVVLNGTPDPGRSHYYEQYRHPDKRSDKRPVDAKADGLQSRPNA